IPLSQAASAILQQNVAIQQQMDVALRSAGAAFAGSSSQLTSALQSHNYDTPIAGDRNGPMTIRQMAEHAGEGIVDMGIVTYLLGELNVIANKEAAVQLTCVATSRK